MIKVRNIILGVILIAFRYGYSQSVEISGQIIGTGNVENIHIINKSKKKYAVSNTKGEFIIEVVTNDTIVFSSVQYKLESIIISKEDILAKKIKVTLESKINELDEVVVGKILTGNLLSDLKNSDAKPKINFYDVGIPGYMGKPKTQSERLLYEADGGNIITSAGGSINGAGAGLNFTKILNKISGRTKMLKARVKLETEERLLFSLKSRLETSFFKQNPLDVEYRMDFFYFCVEDPNFTKRCKNSDLEALLFFKEKYEVYLKNRKNND